MVQNLGIKDLADQKAIQVLKEELREKDLKIDFEITEDYEINIKNID